MYSDAASDLSSPLSSIPSSPLSSPPDSPVLPASWRSLTPPPSHENADDDMPPARKRRKLGPKPRTTQHLDLSSDAGQSEYDRRVALDLLLKTLRKRRKIVVVAGAGISVSAGIPDFRSSHGLFKTLRSEHKLKASGKELFDASVYKDDSSTSSFHDMVRDLSNMAAKATPTPFHHLLARLAQEGRLLRLYTQNVDGIDTSLPPLATQVPLNHKGPWPQTIQLHGGLKKMMCQKCRHTSDFQADLFQGPKPPLCPECEVRDALRTSHAGKRSHGIGKLRPRIVLYNEHNPDEEAIGAVMTSDLRSRPDAIIVVGTSMKIPGVRRIVREMCGVVRSKRNGVSMWISRDPVPPRKEFDDCWDLIVSGDCDEVARQADFKNWDELGPEPLEEYTVSEGERIKSSQGEIQVIIQETPTKSKDRLRGPLNLGGIMTPPVSLDDEMSDRPWAISSEKKSAENPPATAAGMQSSKAKLKVARKNPASLGRSISEVLGKENKPKQSGRPKGSLNKSSRPRVTGPVKQRVIMGKITKPAAVLKAPSPAKEQKAPLSPRCNVNSNALLFPNLLQNYSSTEASPAPESLSENDWRNPATISPNGTIPNGSTQLTRKRKREDRGEKHDHTIEARTLPENQNNVPLTLVLIANLPRSEIPLAWLDSAPSTIQAPARLIFRSEIPKSLQFRRVDGETHNVWVARQTPNGRLYALERLGDNNYVGCLLAGWVTEEQVVSGYGSPSGEFLLQCLLSYQQDPATRENSSRPSSQHGVPIQPFRPSPSKPKNRRGVLARISIMPSKDTTPASQSRTLSHVEQRQRHEEPTISEPAVDNIDARHAIPTNPTKPVKATSLTCDEDQNGSFQPSQQLDDDLPKVGPLNAVPPGAQTILETLHRQYLETLYTSKTSLAYFAKGPLVRARTQMQSISTSHISDLAEFCRDSIIPMKKMDLKYRDSIVKLLQGLVLAETSNGTEELPKVSMKSNAKRKASKRRKIGKDGLYPAEKEFIFSWWRGRTLRNFENPIAESGSRELKMAVADLRNRETEMQVLLVLEALALDAAEKAMVVDQAATPLIKVEPSEHSRDATLGELPQFKRKKRGDLRSELDLLVDRLCIWHTIGLENVTNSSEKNQNLGNGADTSSKDKLKDFCSDVIIPFYSARLPEQCKAICQKLGGPQISPERPRKVLQKSLSSSRTMPGAAVKILHGSIAKRTLQRVLSEDQCSRHGSPPILSRSSTVPSMPNLKRDTTEPPQRPESRGGLQKSRSFANREIDLVSDARSQDAKQKKLANLAKQKQEIDAAINALRKPNRGLAAKEIADEIERHRVEGASLTRRHGPGIQVTATPKRLKRNSAGPSAAFQCGSSATAPLAELLTNSASIPSSATRPSMADQANGRSQIAAVRRAELTPVNDTPVRECSKRSEALGLAKSTHGSEVSADVTGDGDTTTKKQGHAASVIQATPSAARLRLEMLTSIQNTPLRMKKSQKPVLFTAVKKADVRIDDVFRDAHEIPERAGKAMARVMGGGSEMSIYDSLGWNDDFDD